MAKTQDSVATKLLKKIAESLERIEAHLEKSHDENQKDLKEMISLIQGLPMMIGVHTGDD